MPIIAAFLLLIPIRSSAESLMGTVLSVDREKGQIVLQVETENDQQREITLQAAGALPACVLVGSQVRAWGNFAPGEKGKFSATDLRGPGRHPDATGVLARLHSKHPRSSRHITRTNRHRSPRRRRHGRR